jgi:hypothetical protein
MSSNRDQHFVPQFYLRGFSEDQGSISLLNLKRRKIVDRASIAGQCQEDHLYGVDSALDKALGDMETAVAPIIADVVEKEQPPSQTDWSHADLLLFIAAQHFRTPRFAAESDEMLNKMGKQILASRLQDFWKIGVHPATWALRRSGFKSSFPCRPVTHYAFITLFPTAWRVGAPPWSI